MAGLHIGRQSLADGDRIDAGMPSEPPVLKFYQRCEILVSAILVRIGPGSETPLSVGCNPGSEKFPVSVSDNSRVNSARKQISRQAEKIP